MPKPMKRILFWTFLIVVSSSVSFGQFVQTGSLNGTVKDDEGSALPGVGVTIKSPALILPEMNVLTNVQGIYRFPSLPLGLYEVTFSLEGMTTLVRKDIVVKAGQATRIDVVLQFKALETTIVVTGQSPTIDVKSTTHATNIDKDMIASLPASRDLDAYFNMAPGVVAEANANGLMSSANGSSVRDNSFSIDGVNMTAPDTGTQRFAMDMDIMEELTIQSGGLPAEYGDSMGTQINIITKSGGNTFSGSASLYYADDSLQSDNTEGTPLEGRLSGIKYNFAPGFTLGGPIVKNKLWFFTSAAFTKNATNVPGYPWDETETIAAEETKIYGYGKLTFQPDVKNKIVLSYSFSDYLQDAANAGYYQTVSSTIEWDSPIHVLNFQWTHFFNDVFFADFKVGYMKSSDALKPKGDSAIHYELATGNYSGNYFATDTYTANRLQINASGTRFLDNAWGTHELKFGAEFQKTDASRTLTPNRDAQNQMTQIVTYFGIPVLGYWLSDQDSKEATANYFAFLQDSWQPAKNLILSLGLRFSHQRSIIPAQNENEDPITIMGITLDRSVPETLTPIKRTDVTPRLGLTYDLTGDGKTVIRASYSRYIQSNLTQYFAAVNPNSSYYYISFLMPDGTPIPDYYAGLWYSGAAKAGYGDYALKSPYTDEFTAGVERELFPDWSLAFRYIKKLERNLIEDVDASQLDIDTLMETGELVWTNWEQVSFVDPYDGQTKTVWNQKSIVASDVYLVNPPGAKRDYDGIEVTLTKRYSQGWSLMSSYVWQHSRGLIGTDYSDSFGLASYYNNPNAHINAYGEMPLERQHQFKLQGMVKGPWGINVSGSFRYLSGGRYTRQINTSDLGLFLAQGYEIIYAEERGSSELPALTLIDLRLEKSFRLKGITWNVFIDGFNLLNEKNAISVQTVSSSPLITYGQMTAVQNPRLFRLGTRFSF